jgi:septum formation topological specificity factor MinE
MQTNFDVYFAKLKSEVLSVVEKYVCKCNADNRFVLFLLLCAVR